MKGSAIGISEDLRIKHRQIHHVRLARQDVSLSFMTWRQQWHDLFHSNSQCVLEPYVIFQKVGSLMKSVLIFRHWTCIGGTALDCAPGPTMFLTEIINMPCGMCFANFLHLQGAFRKLSLFSGQVSWIAGSLFQTVLGWLETGYSKRWEQHVQRQKDPAGKLELELEISALPLKATSCYLDLYICIHIYFKQIKIL